MCRSQPLCEWCNMVIFPHVSNFFLNSRGRFNGYSMTRGLDIFSETENKWIWFTLGSKKNLKWVLRLKHDVLCVSALISLSPVWYWVKRWVTTSQKSSVRPLIALHSCSGSKQITSYVWVAYFLFQYKDRLEMRKRVSCTGNFLVFHHLSLSHKK